MADPIIIVGAGGLGRETAVLIEHINASTGNQWDLVGFVDDDYELNNRQVLSYPVLGTVDWLFRKNASFVVAVGNPKSRRMLTTRLEQFALRPATLIHPTVTIHPSIDVGSGSLIFQGAVIMLAVQLGCGVVVDANSTVGHDSIIGDFTTVHPGVNLSGNAKIGAESRLGAGSVVLPGIRIGEGTTVGAGAVVNRDLPDACTAVGVPARPVDDS